MSKSKSKTPPRRLPCSEADVKRARTEGREEGLRLALTVMLYVLADKFGFSDEQICRASQWFNTNVAAILSGDIEFTEMQAVLRDEYGWEFEMT